MQAATIVSPVQAELDSLEKLLESVAAVDPPFLSQLLQHVLAGKGKRMRPAIAFLIARMCGAPAQDFIHVAAAVELLHTATLVHDDMIDSAATRRGLPTLHILAGERTSILVGDYLFARAAHFAAQAGNLRVMSTFAQVLMDICDGELRQLSGNGSKLISREEYYRRIENKTASLFRATTEMSGVLSHASEEQVQALRRYGYHLGMAFQIVDDILDVIGDEAELGKPAGNDLRQGTITLPIIYLAEVQPNNPQIDRLRLGSLGEDDIRSLIGLARSSGAVSMARDEAVQHVDAALASLAGFAASAARESLENLARFSLSRTS